MDQVGSYIKSILFVQYSAQVILHLALSRCVSKKSQALPFLVSDSGCKQFHNSTSCH